MGREQRKEHEGKEKEKRGGAALVSFAFFAPFVFFVLLFFLPALLSPDTVVMPPRSPYSDLLITHWPNAEFLRRSLEQYGQIPLWRPSPLSGTPFAANPLSTLFYPPAWLLLVLPLPLGFNLLTLAHVILAGGAMYALARREWGLSAPAATVAALTYMFAPRLMAHLGAGHVGFVWAWAWGPVVVGQIGKSANRQMANQQIANRQIGKSANHESAWRQAVKGAVGAGAVLAVQFMADVRVAFYTAAMGALYVLWCKLQITTGGAGKCNEGRRIEAWKWLRWVGMMALVVIVFAGMGAVQMVPLLEAMGHLSRAGLSLAEAGVYSLPPRYLLGLLLADRGGFHEWMTYVGLGSLLLAGLGVVAWPWRRVGFPVLLSLGGALFALGIHGPLFPLLYRLIPGLSWLRVPARAWLAVVFGVSLLAGLGVEALEQFPPRLLRRRGGLTRLGVAAGLGLVGLGGGMLAMYGELPSALGGLTVAAPITLAVILLRLHGRLGRRAWAPLLVIIVTAELWWMDGSLFVVRPVEQVFREGREVADFLCQQEGLFRVYSPSYSLPQHLTALYGIQTADGVDPLQLARYRVFMQYAGGYEDTGYTVTIPPFPEGADVRTAWREARPEARLLGLLNVRYVVAAFPISAEGLRLRGWFGEDYIYENERTMPRAWVVHQVKEVEEEKAALEAVLSIDPKEEAVVEVCKSANQQIGKWADGKESGEQVQVREYTPNRVVVEAKLESAGLLVLSEIWYPGWRAYVDGRDVPVCRVDYLLRGVFLEAGRHKIVFAFRPVSVLLGGAVSGITLLGLVVLAVVWRRSGQ